MVFLRKPLRVHTTHLPNMSKTNLTTYAQQFHSQSANELNRRVSSSVALVSGKTGSGMGGAPRFCSLENNCEAGTTLLLCFSIEGFMLQQLLHSTGKTGNYLLPIINLMFKSEYICQQRFKQSKNWRLYL
ncbi:hypothetical protein J6590_008597 [Homalodisca vitripennis]|nr:hypothetical protein J6590_008597 [Homalodisca vitripennis]